MSGMTIFVTISNQIAVRVQVKFLCGQRFRDVQTRCKTLLYTASAKNLNISHEMLCNIEF